MIFELANRDMSRTRPPTKIEQELQSIHGEFMASMTITDIPEDLHRRLKSAARIDGCSPNQEALAILNRVLRPAPIALPKPIIPLRAMSAEEILLGIREGRE